MAYAGVILEKDGKFLLQLRDSGGLNSHKWGLFGGGIEAGEDALTCAMRELEEELSLHVVDLKQVYRGKVGEEEVTIFYHTLKVEIGELTLREGADLKLFSIEEMQELEHLVEGLKKFLGLFHSL